MTFQIESTTFCPHAFAPRWSWWIRGIAGTSRYGIVGTDEQGKGLYLYHARGDQMPSRTALRNESDFCIAENTSKAEATNKLLAALFELGWGTVNSASSALKTSNVYVPSANWR